MGGSGSLGGGTVYHILLMLKFGVEAAYNVFHKVGLDVSSLFQIQLSCVSEV